MVTKLQARYSVALLVWITDSNDWIERFISQIPGGRERPWHSWERASLMWKSLFSHLFKCNVSVSLLDYAWIDVRILRSDYGPAITLLERMFTRYRSPVCLSLTHTAKWNYLLGVIRIPYGADAAVGHYYMIDIRVLIKFYYYQYLIISTRCTTDYTEIW